MLEIKIFFPSFFWQNSLISSLLYHFVEYMILCINVCQRLGRLLFGRCAVSLVVLSTASRFSPGFVVRCTGRVDNIKRYIWLKTGNKSLQRNAECERGSTKMVVTQRKPGTGRQETNKMLTFCRHHVLAPIHISQSPIKSNVYFSFNLMKSLSFCQKKSKNKNRKHRSPSLGADDLCLV